MTASSLGRRLEDRLRALGDPPRLVFHIVVGLFGVGLLWAGSLPGAPFVPLMLLSWVLSFGALIWAGKLLLYCTRRRRGVTRPGAGRWFLVAPIGGVLVAAALVSGLAFDVRWALSQASFDQAVAAASDPAGAANTAPGRVGLYRVLGQPHVIGDAIFFHHPLGGGVFDDAGFAYLPSGPTSDVEASFESLRTRQIDGSWYRWWSSW